MDPGNGMEEIVEILDRVLRRVGDKASGSDS